MYRLTTLLIVLTLLAPTWFVGAAAAADATTSTSRISVATDGAQSNGASARPAISADGRYVVFQSWASNLVPNDTNNAWDIFVRDRITSTTTRVSVASNGDQPNSSSYSPSISADGRFVAFQSDATNLVSDDSNGHSDIFIRDLQTGMTSIVSLASDGSPANGDSSEPCISGNGHYVAFTSDASNLVIGDINGVSDVFVRDLESGDVFVASTNAVGDMGSRGSSGASISDDGRLTVFQYQTTSLVPVMDHPETYVYDLNDHTARMVSISNSGYPANASTYRASISGNSEYVGFDSGSTNLVSEGVGGMYLRNLRTGLTSQILPTGMGVIISDDGRFLVFAADRQLLDQNDTRQLTDVYRFDRQTGGIARVSVSDTGAPGNSASGIYQFEANSHSAAVSGTGEFVAFTSHASDLVPGDTNGDWDIFVRDFGNDEPPRGPGIPVLDGLFPLPFSTVAPGQTEITATIHSDSPLSELDLRVDGVRYLPESLGGTGSSNTVGLERDLAPGVHTITITAYDADRDNFQAQWDVIAGNLGETEWFTANGTVNTSQFNATMRSLVESFRWHLYGQSWDGADHPDLPTHVGLAVTGAPLETWANNGQIDQAATTATLRSLVESFRWHFWGISWDGNAHPDIPTHSSQVLPPQSIDPWFTSDGKPIPANINATLRSLVESFRWHFWGYSWDGQHHPEIPLHAK